MAEKSTSAPLVTVSRDAVQALSEPRFIIRVGEVYYVTVAVLEYHPGKATTDQHLQGVQQVAQAFSQGQQVPAVSHPGGPMMAAAGHTNPPQQTQ